MGQTAHGPVREPGSGFLRGRPADFRQQRVVLRAGRLCAQGALGCGDQRTRLLGGPGRVALQCEVQARLGELRAVGCIHASAHPERRLEVRLRLLVLAGANQRGARPAGQTGRATAEIAEQITRIQGSTEKAVTAIGGIAGRIGEISDASTAVAAAVQEQGAATREIVRNIGEAAKGTGEVTGGVVQVAGAADETGAAATQVLSAVRELARQSEHLRGEVGRFLTTVRAA